MIELTSVQNLPVFVSIKTIDVVEQKLSYTEVVLKSGKIVEVLEDAGEIYRELQELQENQLEKQLIMAQGVMGNA